MFRLEKRIQTNQDTDFLRLIACICMMIDHAGKMLFPQYPVMRMIGRLAFPLFAYGIAVGAFFTRDPLRYLSRIAITALISQPLYALALDHQNAAMYAVSFASHPIKAAYTFYISSWQTPSILLSLFMGLCLLLCLREKQYSLALFVYILCECMSSHLDYGIGGIRQMLLFYLFLKHPLPGFFILTGYTLLWSMRGRTFGLRIYSLPAVMLCFLPMKRRMRLPRWFSYAFYPVHLAILLAVLLYLGRL